MAGKLIQFIFDFVLKYLNFLDIGFIVREVLIDGLYLIRVSKDFVAVLLYCIELELCASMEGCTSSLLILHRLKWIKYTLNNLLLM